MVAGRSARAKPPPLPLQAFAATDTIPSLDEIDDEWDRTAVDEVPRAIPRANQSGIRELRRAVVPPPLPPPPLPPAAEEFETVDTFEEVVPFPFSWPIPAGAEVEPLLAPSPPRLRTFLRTARFFSASLACGLVALAGRAVRYLRAEWTAASARARS